MKRIQRIALLLAAALVLTGCGVRGNTDMPTAAPTETTAQGAAEQPRDETVGQEEAAASKYFSNRDLDAGYDTQSVAAIRLNGSSAACSSNAVQISGSTVTITDEGTYILSGTLDNGMVVVNTAKENKVQIVLDGASIHSETSAPIYILQADKVFLTLAEESENVLSNGGTFTAIDENNIDAVIFSKEDLTLNGTGSLTVTSPAGHGIVSKDELSITGGSYQISAASHGISGKDNVCVTNAALEIAAGKDGIQADNDEDATLGFAYIAGGTFTISAEGDGVSASSYLQIDGGSFDITTGGGSENGAKQTSDSWGGFMGGGGRGGRGGIMGGGSMDNMAPETEEEDSTSIKGLKASGELIINAGTFSINSADDAVHSNTSLTIRGGEFEIATGDDGFHADETLTVSAGTIWISESYEGLEGLDIVVSGGNIRLVASDDGLNAAGGTDQSGFGGNRGGDMFGGPGGMMGGSSKGSILISGGDIYVNASGDGIDANGTLEITGGYTVVCGPTMGDTATLDYDTSAMISGGTFIGTGASGMAQTFSDSGQGVIAVSVGNRAAATQITLTDSAGRTVISYAPELSFGVVILSSPEIVKGETYTISVGTASAEFEAS